MPRQPEVDGDKGLNRACRLLAEALDLLDACAVGPHISAHIELALAEIRRVRGDGTLAQ